MYMQSSFWLDCNCMAPVFLQTTARCFVFCTHPPHTSVSSDSSQCAPSSLSIQKKSPEELPASTATCIEVREGLRAEK